MSAIEGGVPRRFSVLLGAAAVLAVAVAVLAWRNVARAAAGADWVNHTHAVLHEVAGWRGAFQASEAALRTLALSGQDADEAACREALANLEESLTLVRALLRNEAEAQGAVARLDGLTAQRAALTREVLAAHRGRQSDEVRRLLGADTAGGGAAEGRRTTERLRLETMAQLAARDREAFVQTRMVQWAMWGGVGLNALLLGLAGWVVREDVQVRRRAAAALEAANRELEGRVQARTAELSQANAQLKAENLEQRWGAQALEHQLRYNELIVNSISDLVLVLTKAKTISRVNPAVTHVTGREAAELVSHPLAAFVTLTAQPAEYPAVVGDPLGQALKEGRDLRDAPAAIADRKGARVPVRLTLFPLRDRDKTVGGVAILRVDPGAGGAAGAGREGLS